MVLIVDPEGRETEALRHLVKLRGKDVLEIGCGDGRVTRRLAPEAASVLGVDPDSCAPAGLPGAGAGGFRPPW